MSGTGEKASATTKTPADFLKSIRGRPVVVKLNSGVDYRGQSLSVATCFRSPFLEYGHNFYLLKESESIYFSV